jgi:hypothetical protein
MFASVSPGCKFETINDACSLLSSSASRKLHDLPLQFLTYEQLKVFPSLHSIRLKIKQLTSRNLKRNIFRDRLELTEPTCYFHWAFVCKTIVIADNFGMSLGTRMFHKNYKIWCGFFRSLIFLIYTNWDSFIV